MRIPGVLLRTPVTITTPGVSKGDGPAEGVSKTVKGFVKKRVSVTNDDTGQTISVWATVRIRPTTKMPTTPPRAPGAGDSMSVDGSTRLIESVEPVRGPGTAVAFLELIAGDG